MNYTDTVDQYCSYIGFRRFTRRWIQIVYQIFLDIEILNIYSISNSIFKRWKENEFNEKYKYKREYEKEMMKLVYKSGIFSGSVKIINKPTSFIDFFENFKLIIF